MGRRVREVLGPATHSCSLCGSSNVDLVLSRTRRSPLDFHRVTADKRLSEICRDCGARAVTAA